MGLVLTLMFGEIASFAGYLAFIPSLSLSLSLLFFDPACL